MPSIHTPMRSAIMASLVGLACGAPAAYAGGKVDPKLVTRPAGTRLLLAGASAAADAPYPGTRTVASKHGFDELVSRVEAAVSDHKMGLVAHRGAAARGVKIPGNAVLMVFRNDYA